MKFSTFHLFTQMPGWTEQQEYDYELQIIEWADELGFDTAWIAEHHFRDYGIVPNTMMLMANLAARTKKIRLGNAIVIMPFHHPLRVAEDAGLLDLLSGGRLNFGFGRGYQGVEFAAFETSMDDTRAKTDEAVDIILEAWKGEPFSHHGKYWNFDEVRVVPQPIQKPHPPLFFASIHPDSIRHNAKRGVPFIVDSTIVIDQLKESVADWRRIAKENKSHPDPENAEHTTMRSIMVTDTAEQAKDYILGLGASGYFADSYNPTKPGETELEIYARQSAPIDPKTGRVAPGYEYWEKGYLGRQPIEFESNTEESWDKRWVAGDPDRVIAKFEELEEVGMRNIMCMFAANDPRFGPFDRLPLPDMRKLMERFAREVMPHFAKKEAAKAKQSATR